MSHRLASPLSALAVVGASVALVACGGSSNGSSSTAGASSTTGTTGSASGGTATASLQKWQQCLKDNGVTAPTRPGNGQGGPGAGQGGPGGGNGYGPPQGGFGGGGANGGKFGKAMQACAKYRPQGAGGPGGGNGQRPRTDVKAFTPYLTCLKDQGLDVKVSDGFNALRNLKQSDPKVQAAFKSCQSKLPQRPNGNGNGNTQPQGTTTTGTT
jgi:hypothetical protein